MQVLIVEDDPDTRANLTDILELDHHEVETASSVASVMACRDLARFGVILLDRQLPDGTALELLPRLKRLAPEASILVITGYADLEGAIAALRLGAADYILKPVHAEALRASLTRIAKLKQAQEKALQAERLATLGQMVTGLAHESRNALQLIQASLEVLALEIQDRPEALELVASIQAAEDRLHRLFEDIRGYAAPLSLERDIFDISKVWRSAWLQLAGLRQGRDAVLHEETHGLDLRLGLDLFSFERVFRNIFENALTAAPGPVRIEVHFSRTELDGQPAMRIAVRDDGPGLRAEQRARIFEPFYTTKKQGTGLGMSIVQRIVEAHGGRIGIGDRTGPGAEIVMVLPCVQTELLDAQP